jgi:ureidoacrylate peracid hydrolase
VFISTNIDYVLRNLGVRSLMIAGVLTDQCIDSAVRDACDLGYLVTVPIDACATLSAERHEWALRNNRGYCRQVTTGELVREIQLSLRGA